MPSAANFIAKQSVALFTFKENFIASLCKNLLDQFQSLVFCWFSTILFNPFLYAPMLIPLRINQMLCLSVFCDHDHMELSGLEECSHHILSLFVHRHFLGSHYKTMKTLGDHFKHIV